MKFSPKLKERALPPALDALTSETRLAPPGQDCTRCLCCPAIIGFEGEWLCAACDDGTHAPLPERPVAPPIHLPPPVVTPKAPRAAARQKKKQADRRHQIVRVKLRHTEKDLDAWWKSLSFDRKLKMFEQLQDIRVEGTVS